jgi:nitroreductase
MINSNFYKTIFKRKSVRKYDLTELNDKTLLDIKEFISSVKPLYGNIETQMRIVSKEEINLLVPIKAPHYLMMTSQNKEGYLTNAGYMLQQVDLFLSTNGFGSCYIGMALPTRDTKRGSELDFVIILAFGNPAEAVYRDDVSQFKRKPLLKITNIVNYDRLIEPARLAPSATNSQPWFFTGENGLINCYCVKSNIIKAFVYEKFNKIDMGIAICHIAVAAKHLGKQINFISDKSAMDNHPKGYYYITTAMLK